MSVERATYLDSSAIVKLVVAEPESAALLRYLRRRRPLVSSGLARAEVGRALLPLGEQAVRRGQEVLARLELIRISDRIFGAAARRLGAAECVGHVKVTVADLSLTNVLDPGPVLKDAM